MFLNASSETEPPELSETNSTFERAHSVRFLGYDSGSQTQGEIKGTRDWFSRLRSFGCNRILLEVLETELGRTDTALLGYHMGEIPWAVRTVQSSTATSWLPRWMTIPEFRKPSAEKRIWDVTYSPRPGRTPAIEDMGLEKARSQLKETLEEALNFSSRSKLSWSNTFEKALQNLSTDQPDFASHHDLIPQAYYSLQARQLLAAALQSWVFGGMGWWNDMDFYNPLTKKRYNAISRKLYASILTALAVAVNQHPLTSN